MLYFQTWKVILVLGICVLGLLFAAPNVMPQNVRDQLPPWMSKTLNLGLDLQGGVHLLWEVDSREIVVSRLETVEDDVRQEFRANDVGYTGIGVVDEHFQVRVRDLDQLTQAVSLVEDLSTPVTGTGFSGSAQDIAVSSTEDGLITVVLTEEALDQLVGQAVTQSI